MPVATLTLTREQILAHRRRVQLLDGRLPVGTSSLRRAAAMGLTDSMPRAAVLSVHARVEDTPADVWEDAAFIQTWGPRFSAYVVAAEDRAVFTLGRLPDDPGGLRRAITTADRLEAFLAGRSMRFGEAGHGMGIVPNSLRYAATTGRVLIRWDGARQPTIWTIPPPDVEPREARLELARRFFHASGPGAAAGFSSWAGIKPKRAIAIVDDLAGELRTVRTPIGEGWILASDEASFRRGPLEPPDATSVRLLPSGDAYTLHQGADRDLLVPDPARRDELWTTRVWPGAILAGREIVGTWRRSERSFRLRVWDSLSVAVREAIETEAASLPLPGTPAAVRIAWED